MSFEYLDLKFLLLEIPEFEKNEFPEKIYSFNILGLNSEKPIVRIDNMLFEGKWYICIDSSLFFIQKLTPLNYYECSPFFQLTFFFNTRKKKQSSFRKIKINYWRNLNNKFIKKRLRLHRIPLLIETR